MGITKLLIIVLLFWLIYRVYISFKSRTKKETYIKTNKKIIPCDFCNTHVPITSAIKVDNKYFCSLDHSKNA